ncbi:LLM class flavin-dependent oxidoreductase [Pseudomonas poae]|nr:LLM class flavin-dependent oxidoreductase [Pseudomonas poae]
MYFGGASEAAERVGAAHGQTYLMWCEPPAMIAERIQRMRDLAAAQGRTLRFGLRLHRSPPPPTKPRGHMWNACCKKSPGRHRPGATAPGRV